MWVARNQNGTLLIFINKPSRIKYPHLELGHWEYFKIDEYDERRGYREKGFEIPNNLFPSLAWEDEPEEVSIYMKNPIHKEHCTECGKDFKYHNSDVKVKSYWQAATDYEDWSYIVCPYCGKEIEYK